MQNLTRSQIIDYLRFYSEQACADLWRDAPINHMLDVGVKESPSREMPEMAYKPSTPPPIMPTHGEVHPARAPENHAHITAQATSIAAQADNLDDLKHALQNFDGCALKKTAKHTVFCDGVPYSRVMLIGEAPGRDEDRLGKPFVGRSGQLLDLMFAAIGLNRAENMYVSNIIPWRPPGNRTPNKEEISQCKPFIMRHIELARPDFLVLVGGIAAKTILDTQQGITKLRGKWHNYTLGARNIPVLPILHPAFILRTPERKIDVWADLCNLAEKLDETKL